MSGKLVQEEDRIATGKIIATAVISLAIFGVGVIWAISIQRATAENHSVISPLNAAPAAEKGAPEVGIVYQWPFDISKYGADKKAEVEARLNHYGWVDKNAKVVHIPIEEAMQKYVSQAGAGK